MEGEELNRLSRQVLNAAFQVHSHFGPGLLESAYTACLVHEFRKAGMNLQTQVPVALIYDAVKLADVGFRMDILVEGEIVVEVKSVDTVSQVHLLQLVTYLKLADKRLGLLLNFNVASLKEGIFRRVHRF